jgi:hypothetical protein
MRIRELFRQVTRSNGWPAGREGDGNGPVRPFFGLDHPEDLGNAPAGNLPEESAPEPGPGQDDRETIADLLSECAFAFEEGRDRLLPAARRLLERGPDVAGTGASELRDCLRRLVALRDAMIGLEAACDGLPTPSAAPTGSQAAPPAEFRPEVAWETRRRALGVLDWVLALATRDRAEVPEIGGVLDAACSLRIAIDGAPLPELPAEAHPLATGDHPLALLLRLSALHDTMSDDSWDELRTAVGRHFGKGMAGAAARGKIVFTEPAG